MEQKNLENRNCIRIFCKEDIANAHAFAEKALAGRIKNPEELVTCQLV